MTRIPLWKRIRATLDVSPDGLYALLSVDEVHSYLFVKVDDEWKPLRSAAGTLPITTIGDASQRIATHRWGMIS